MKGEAKAKVSEPGGQERVTDENGDFGGRYRASEAERYSRKSGVNVPDSTAMRWSSVDVPMCAFGQGSIRAALGTTLGVLGTSKMKENERFYGFTDYRGPAAQRGRDGHGSPNQVTAG